MKNKFRTPVLWVIIGYLLLPTDTSEGFLKFYVNSMYLYLVLLKWQYWWLRLLSMFI